MEEVYDVHQLLINPKASDISIIDNNTFKYSFKFDTFGELSFVSDVYIRWLKMPFIKNMPTLPKFLSLTCEQLTDKFITDDYDSVHKNSTFIIPLKGTDDLVLMSEALGNHVVFNEPIVSLNKLDIVIRSNESISSLTLQDLQHTILLSVRTHRKKMY